MALVVMWAGVGIAKDTLEPLIGEAVDPEVYQKIKHFVEKYDGIEGTHDLIVHNYGPNRRWRRSTRKSRTMWISRRPTK